MTELIKGNNIANDMFYRMLIKGRNKTITKDYEKHIFESYIDGSKFRVHDYPNEYHVAKIF